MNKYTAVQLCSKIVDSNEKETLTIINHMEESYTKKGYLLYNSIYRKIILKVKIVITIVGRGGVWWWLGMGRA